MDQRNRWPRKFSRLAALVLVSAAVVLAGTRTMAGQNAQGGQGDQGEDNQGRPPQERITFPIVRSAKATGAGCLANAQGKVTITSIGPVEVMRVNVSGLPPNTEFDFFVIQVPNAPFGLAWYQGDIETDDEGEASQVFIGRFNIETFIVATGTAPAPVVHDDGPFPDASSNPVTNPVHTYHLGLWFNSPDDATAAGCPADVTPFNGDHTAGIQVLSSRNFPDDQGPLRQLVP
jgi:hypothetical protein